jgi:hypothetical protein
MTREQHHLASLRLPDESDPSADMPFETRFQASIRQSMRSTSPTSKRVKSFANQKQQLSVPAACSDAEYMVTRYASRPYSRDDIILLMLRKLSLRGVVHLVQQQEAPSA